MKHKVPAGDRRANCYSLSSCKGNVCRGRKQATDPETIATFRDGELDGDDEYYFIATQKPGQ